MRIVKIKNCQTSSDTYVGKTIAAGEYYQLQNSVEIERFASDEKVNQDLWSDPAKILISDGENDLAAIAGDRLLKGIDNHAKDTDNRPVHHSTPRYLGTYTYFTGTDDDHTDPHAVGGSDTNTQSLVWDHSIGDDSLESLYLDYNTIYNDTYIRQGDIMWKDAENDRLSFEMVPKVTNYSSGSNTNFNLYGGFLVIPAAGNGSISIAAEDMVLVQNTPNEFGDLPAGYWDADWNTSTKQFENITAAPNGDGEYNMFGLEVVLFRFMNKRHLLGSGRKDCVTNDVAQLGHNIRVKVTTETMGNDHAWSGNATMMMYRKRTC